MMTNSSLSKTTLLMITRDQLLAPLEPWHQLSVDATTSLFNKVDTLDNNEIHNFILQRPLVVAEIPTLKSKKSTTVKTYRLIGQFSSWFMLEMLLKRNAGYLNKIPVIIFSASTEDVLKITAKNLFLECFERTAVRGSMSEKLANIWSKLDPSVQSELFLKQPMRAELVALCGYKSRTLFDAGRPRSRGQKQPMTTASKPVITVGSAAQ